MKNKSLHYLRGKHPEFVYKSFHWKVSENDFEMNFVFEMGSVTFEPKIVIKNVTTNKIKQLTKEAIDNLVFNVGLSEIPSYWKSACSPNIVIEAGYLTNAQIIWWKKLLISGMSQFYFENKIDYRSKDFLQIKIQKSVLKYPKAQIKSDRPLIPIGGGKDSAVTLEILKDSFKVGAFVLNETKAQKDVIARSGIKDTVKVIRTIDPKLLELNRSGYLNGHTPFSAVIAFLGVLSCYLFDYKYLVLSNEASSDEGNANYLGKVVNHQYSKSSEFEKDFQNYNTNFLSNTVYFSFLRSLTDLQIAQLFAEMGKYFDVFRSCNVSQKTDSWCSNCSKCLSTYILLSPFMSKKTLDKIFGQDLLRKRSLLPMLKDLSLPERIKPLECVGTRDEINACLNWLSDRFNKKEHLVEWYYNNYYQRFKDNDLNKMIKVDYSSQNEVPPTFTNVLKNYLALPSVIRKLKDRTVCLLGMGVEGKDSYQFIRHFLPNKKLIIADLKLDTDLRRELGKKFTDDQNLLFHCGKNYLSVLESIAIAIKSPGISETNPQIVNARKLGKVEFWSNTQLFFESCVGKIIGITGSAGKTTTATLTHHVLKTSGKRCYLAGNVGIAPLELLINSNSPEDLYVFELAAGQLATLAKSPHISVFLNIYREHLDYFKSFDDYFEAKANIALHQTKDDYFIYNSSFLKIGKLAQKVKSQTVAFSRQHKDSAGYLIPNKLLSRYDNQKWLFPQKDLPLLGVHNQLNTLAVMLVAQILGLRKKDVFAAIGNFKPVEHRLEKVAERNGVLFVNDSICSLPESSLYGIDSFSENKEITLLAGGYDRGLGYMQYAKDLTKRKNVKSVILTGQTADEMHRYLLKFKFTGKVYLMKDTTMEERVKKAYGVTQSGGIVLLSSAAASFDMYKNYKDRGEQFREAVNNLD